MKKLFLLWIALLEINSAAYCQNWAPLNPNEQFNYQNDTSIVISSVIFADSVSFDGVDSIYFLNRVVTNCDTCTQFFVLTMLENQPQFLKRTAIVKSGGIWNFKNPGNIALHTLAPQGSTWLFDSISGMNATVDTITVENIFSTLDSVKHIVLQPGDTILLSKSFGILKWPDSSGGLTHSLVGIKGRNLGELLPGFSGIFNFQAGDVLQVKKSESMWDLQNYETFWTIKLNIDSVVDAPGSKHVFGHRVSNTQYYFGGIPSNNFAEQSPYDFVLADSVNHFCNLYPGQLVNCYKLFRDYLPDTSHQPSSFCMMEGFGNDLFQRVRYWRDAQGKICMGLTVLTDMWGTFFSRDTLYPDILIQNQFGIDSILFREGLGITEYTYMNFEISGSWRMEGYVQGGDTFGIITPDSTLLGKHKPIEQVINFQVWPNPADKLIHVEGNWKGPACVRLLSIEGKFFRNIPIEENALEVNVADLPSGVYLLEIQTESGSARKKLVITR